jgi:hypothetical protein
LCQTGKEEEEEEVEVKGKRNGHLFHRMHLRSPGKILVDAK